MRRRWCFVFLLLPSIAAAQMLTLMREAWCLG